MSIWTDFEDFLSNTFIPGVKKFLGEVVDDEVTALAPIAANVVATLEQELISSAGNIQTFGNVAGKVLQQAGTQAAAAGVEAGGAALLSAVGSAIAALNPTKATVSLSSSPAPSPVPAATPRES